MSQRDNLFAILSDNGVEVNEDQKDLINTKLKEMLSYTPSIGVFGKTGVGKSSLCNALFGRDLYTIDDIAACTRRPQEEILKISDEGSIRLIDVPGAGESTERDKEYAELYLKLLPELDAVLWVVKADDRAFASDENFYKNILKPYINKGMPFLIVINQVDKIEPFREWDDTKHEPSVTQWQNIEHKRNYIKDFFQIPLSKVIAVSALEQYNLVNLVSELIYAIPNEKQLNVYANISSEYQTQQIENFVADSTENSIGNIIVDALNIANSEVGQKVFDYIKDSEFGKVIIEGVKKVAGFIGQAVSKLWGLFTGFIL